MTDDDIVKICEKYQIPNTFHLHEPRPKNRVTSSPSNRLAMYEEDLRAGLCLSLHDFIWNVLD